VAGRRPEPGVDVAGELRALAALVSE
jgi:hypothetical protein